MRAELTEEIKAVAREVGMVSSAVYRYYPSRDDLLTALIVDAYDAVGEAAEQADAACDRADLFGRAMATFRAIRAWAVANPQEYALVYGSPVPGYAAPTDTIDPAARVAVVMLQIMVDGVASGALGETGSISTTRVVRSDFAGLRHAFATSVPDDLVSLALLAWTNLFGSISFELFGHFHNIIHDDEGFFDLQMGRALSFLRPEG